MKIVVFGHVQTKAIRVLPFDGQPHQVRHAFDLVLTHNHNRLAGEIGCAPRSVGTVMGTLERMGVVRRERRRIEGVQGRGMAVHFVDPHVAWNGSLDVRKAEAAEAEPPLLTLMEGGRGGS